MSMNFNLFSVRFLLPFLMLLSACRADVDIPVKVLDQDSNPIFSARATIAPINGLNGVSSVTNIDGEVVISTPRHKLLLASSTKEGYYPTRNIEVPSGMYRPGTYPAEESPEILRLNIKEIKNPIPLFAKNYLKERGGPLSIPRHGVPCGYDLERGDWVAPDGEGVISDIIFTYIEEIRSDKDYEKKIVVTFSNEKDGLIAYSSPLFEGSELVSDHYAPESGYQSKWVQKTSRRDGQPRKSNQDLSRNYYLRVRTVLDDDGNIISANYGKIYGDFMSLIYYFNPRENDRNVEFDPHQNLFQRLPEKFRVDRP